MQRTAIETLEDRMLLTAILFDQTHDGSPISITTADVVGTGTLIAPEFDSIIIQSVDIDAQIGTGININLNGIPLESLVIESTSVTNNIGSGILLSLNNVTGMDTLVFENVDVSDNSNLGLQIAIGPGTELTDLTLETVSITDNPGSGLSLTMDGVTGVNDVVFDTLTVTGNGGDAVAVNLNNTNVADFAVAESRIIGAVTVTTNANADRLVFTNNDLDHNDRNIDLTLNGANVNQVIVAESTIDGGVLINAINQTVIGSGRIVNNANITGAIGAEGVLLKVTDSDPGDMVISGNSAISSLTEDSIKIDIDNSPANGIAIKDNVFATSPAVSLDLVVDGNTFAEPFRITNSSPPPRLPGESPQLVSRFKIDLAPAGVILDPDSGTGTPFTSVNGSDLTTGLTAPPTVARGDQTLELMFNDFNPGESFEWIIDVDRDLPATPPPPETTILGSDLVGATVEVDFTDGTTTRTIGGVLVPVPGLRDAARFVPAEGGSGGSGINFSLQDSPMRNLLIENNTIAGNSGGGIVFNNKASDLIDAVIRGNEINSTAQNGVEFDLVDSEFYGSLLQNVVGGHVGHGVTFEPTVSLSGVVQGASNNAEIVITSVNHGLFTGETVVIQGVSGNVAANGVHTVTILSRDQFKLNGVDGSRLGINTDTFTGGGTWFATSRRTFDRVITAVTNTAPIAITSANHGLSSGDEVSISGVLGNTAANGTFAVTVTGQNTFTLNGSNGTGVGPYLGGGTWIPRTVRVGQGGITGATNTGPVVITAGNHGLPTGAVVTVSGVRGNTAANGTFAITVLDANTFQLDGATGNGVYTGGGVYYRVTRSGNIVVASTDEGDVIGDGVRSQAITGATNASPIVIRSSNHDLKDGQIVTVTGVNGNTAANGTYKITVLGQGRFSLQDPVTGADIAGSGSYTNGGFWTLVETGAGPLAGAVGGATNTNPVLITTPNHGLRTGAVVNVTGVRGNTAANGAHTVTVLDSNTFQLDGVVGNGPYTGAGSWVQVPGLLGPVSGASNTNTLIITSVSHGLVSGDVVEITDVLGNLSANGTHTVTRIDNNSFSLNGVNGIVAGIFVPGTGTWTRITGAQGAITGASNDSPMQITTIAHGLQTGDMVTVEGVLGASTANGTFLVTRIDADTFALQGVDGTTTGLYQGGGTWTRGTRTVITTRGHNLTTGDQVRVSNVLGRVVANTTRTVTVLDNRRFVLDVIDGSLTEPYVAGSGTWTRVDERPIEITTPVPHGLTTDEEITVTGVLGNLGANGSYRVLVTSPTTFQLFFPKELPTDPDVAVHGTGTYQQASINNLGGGVWYQPLTLDMSSNTPTMVREARGNDFAANGLAGMNVDLPAGTRFKGDLFDNRFQNNDVFGFDLQTDAGTFDLFVGTDTFAGGVASDSNTFDRNAGAGVALRVNQTGAGSFEVRRNIFTSQRDLTTDSKANGDGLLVRLEGSLGTVDATSILNRSIINGNTFGVDQQGNDARGVNFLMQENTNVESLNVTDNTFIANGDDGFGFFRRDDARIDQVLAENNNFTNNLGDGLELFAQNTTRDLLDFIVENNNITDNGQLGVRTQLESNARALLSLSNNLIDQNGTEQVAPGPSDIANAGGVGIAGIQQVDLFLSMLNNSIRDNFGDGVNTQGVNNVNIAVVEITGDWINNTITGNHGDGVDQDNIAFGSLVWMDNIFDGNGLPNDGVNGGDGVRITDGTAIGVVAMNNRFTGNYDDGLDIGGGVGGANRARVLGFSSLDEVGLFLGDGTVPNMNFFNGNGLGTDDLVPGSDPTPGDEGGAGLKVGNSVFGPDRGGLVDYRFNRNVVIANRNEYMHNTGAGIDASDMGNTDVSVFNSVVFDNGTDGIEINAVTGRNSFTSRNNRVTFNAGRGFDVLNQTGRITRVTRPGGGVTTNTLSTNATSLDVRIEETEIKSNSLSGVYVVNSASESQEQTGPGDRLDETGQYDTAPDLDFHFIDNEVESNGNTTDTNVQGSLGTMGALVIWVGTSDGLRQTVSSFGVGIDDTTVDIGKSQQIAQAKIEAEILDNRFEGNAGTDVYIDSFRSTIDPPTVTGTWTTTTFAPNPFFRDPQARIDLAFRGNTGNELDVTNGRGPGSANYLDARYNNNEPVFKSRLRAPSQLPGGPFNSGTRQRNATITFGVGIPNNPAETGPFFDYDGFGPNVLSTFRIENDFEQDGFDFISGFSFSNFNNSTLNIDEPGGLGNGYRWDRIAPGTLFGITPDRFEENDAPAAAKSVFGPNEVLPPKAIGNLSIPFLNIDSPGDDDWYFFRAAQTGGLTVDATFIHQNGDLALELYSVPDPNLPGNVIPITTVDTVTDNERLTSAVTGGEYYMIRVFSVPGEVNRSYDLTLNLPVDQDRLEPNDAIDSRRFIGGGGTFTVDNLTLDGFGDDDWYEVKAAGTGTMDIDVLFDNSFGDLDVTIYDPSLVNFLSNPIAVLTSNTDNESASIPVVQGGRYYILVTGVGLEINPSYSISINGPIGEDVEEQNDTLATAVEPGPPGNNGRGLHSGLTMDLNDVGPGSGGDFYRFTSIGGSETVTILFDHAQGDLVLRLMTIGGAVVATSDISSISNNFESVTANLVNGQDYIVNVTGDAHGCYDMIIGTIPPDQFENNDTDVTANPAPFGFFGGAFPGQLVERRLTMDSANDDDFYSIIPQFSGTLFVQINFEHELGNLNLELQDLAGNVIASSVSNTDDEVLGAGVVANTPYRIRVLGVAGAVNPDYEIIADLQPAVVFAPGPIFVPGPVLPGAVFGPVAPRAPAASFGSTSGGSTVSGAQTANAQAAPVFNFLTLPGLPTADIVNVVPDPRNTSVQSITVTFSEDVTGVDITDFTLTRDGNSIGLASLSVVEVDPMTYTINLNNLVVEEGDYVLTLDRVNSGIIDTDGFGLEENATEEFTISTLVDNVNDTVDADPNDALYADSLGRSTLRAAIMQANASPGNDRITLAGSTTTPAVYALTIDGSEENAGLTGDLDIHGNLTIVGAGPGATIIDGSMLNQLDRLFHIHPMVNVTIRGVTIRGGAGIAGGAILNEGTLTLIDTVIESSTAVTHGGAILNTGRLTIETSRMTGNRASSRGGAIYNEGILIVRSSTIDANSANSRGGGAIYNASGTVALFNSTVSGNTTNSRGGGIFNDAGAAMTITNSTIANNHAGSRGGGIENAGGTVSVINTLIATNTAVTADNDVRGSFASLGNNLIGDAGTTPDFDDGINNDIVGRTPADIKMQPLGIDPNRENSTSPWLLTHALDSGSIAIDAGTNTVRPEFLTVFDPGVPLDNRLAPRFIDVNGDRDYAIDIGAFEFFDDTIIVEIVVTPNPAAPGEDVTINASGTFHPNLDAQLIYEWDLDEDGQFDDATGAVITHQFPTFDKSQADGAFTITVHVFEDVVVPLPFAEAFSSTDVAVNQGNREPVADVGGPYSIDFGADLQLDGSSSTDPDIVFGDSLVLYEWDLDNDGQFDDATTVNPLITFNTLDALGLGARGNYPIGLRVTDCFGLTHESATTLTVALVDYGDAPDTYSTFKLSNGARHAVVDGFHLGSAIDPESDGNPTFDADGDDLTQLDDEDGIIFGSLETDNTLPVVTSVTVFASAPGKLDGWIDFGQNGAFEHGGVNSEHLFGGTSIDLVAGPNRVDFNIPPGIGAGQYYARFRFSTAGNLAPTGRAVDGEVEDYVVQILAVQDPVSPTMLRPIGPETSDLTPQFTWTQHNEDRTYRLVVRENDSGAVIVDQSGLINPTYTPSIDLPAAEYTATVFGINGLGESSLASDPLLFTVVRIGMTAPSGNITDMTPLFTWTGVAGTDHYNLKVTALTASGNGSFTVSDLPGTVTSFQQPTDLPIGLYEATIQAFDRAQEAGNPSVALPFAIRTAPTVTAPIGRIRSSTPTFNWDDLLGAVRYEIVVNDITRNLAGVINVTTLTQSQFVAQQVLPLGLYEYTVRGINADGQVSDFSEPVSFTVAAPTTMTAPRGRLDDPTPTFVWEALPGAETYQIWVDNVTSGNEQEQVILESGLTGTSFTAKTALPLGNYQAWVRGRVGSVRSGWTQPVNFSVTTSPELLTPEFATFANNPEFTWTAVPGADFYQVLVQQRINGQVVEQPILLRNIRDTKLVSPLPLLTGDYQFTVRGRTDGGFIGDWSFGQNFHVGDAPVMRGPSGRITDSTPTILWDNVEGAATYELKIDNITNGQTEVILVTTATTSYTVPDDLGLSLYRAFVRAADINGAFSDFSVPISFTVATAPVMLTPSGPTFATTPLISWTTVPEAAFYDLTVNQTSTGTQVFQLQNLTTNSFAPPSALTNGTYEAFVRARTASGDVVSEVSTPITWSVGGAPTMTELGSTTNQTPLFTWNLVGQAIAYEIRIDQIGGQLDLIVEQIADPNFTANFPFELGDYRARVRAIRQDSTFGPFSEPMFFTIAELIAPGQPLGGQPLAITLPLSGAQTVTDTSVGSAAGATWITETGNGEGLDLQQSWSVDSDTVVESPVSERRSAASSPVATVDPAIDDDDTLDSVLADWITTDWWDDVASR